MGSPDTLLRSSGKESFAIEEELSPASEPAMEKQLGPVLPSSEDTLATETKTGPNLAFADQPHAKIQIDRPKKGQQSSKLPGHFDNYVCYNAHSIDPISHAISLQKGSSGTRYPLKNYVTCTKFFASHHQCLAATFKIEGPKFYRCEK